MRQADRARPDWCKLDAACSIAACVIELALRQGDRFGVIAIGGSAPLVLAPAGGARARDRCLLQLARLEPAGTWPGEQRGPAPWERIGPQSLVLLVSDFFDEAAVTLATRLAAAHRETLAIQVLAADERDFPFEGGHRFVDPETGAERRVDAAAARSSFLAGFAAARAALAQRMAGAGIRLATHVLDDAVDAPLQVLFGRPSDVAAGTSA
jgi:uncharacterized protein (DUF58 family)